MSGANIPKKVVVSDYAVPFVARGGRVFSKLVLRADPDVNPGDEVLVLDRNDRVITVAKAY
ncbi:MAG: pseudouridine synthase [Methanothrix sp.]|jgi:Prefoldin, molecular chaperone implicated in de novo protein folding, alpha subunit|uniref:PUA domain containing protein n=1 Tax=Methanothrix thermoacetophila (strain DSM 6194 / JCM 14653 / NBRC 101360 / PT) TaxID=349307 RepID=A0B6S4_METTP|nr:MULTISPECIES: PUA domain-containing protein [Methanothrix]ABK14398.1 PUA domain containing protein [Methanothrix thermoacetophila PT]MBC7079607.1 pseudouridine synthase [Methanothrix sp.]NPU87576.1 pseudouridine synthase [Methanothrix sp.]